MRPTSASPATGGGCSTGSPALRPAVVGVDAPQRPKRALPGGAAHSRICDAELLHRRISVYQVPTRAAQRRRKARRYAWMYDRLGVLQGAGPGRLRAAGARSAARRARPGAGGPRGVSARRLRDAARRHAAAQEHARRAAPARAHPAASRPAVGRLLRPRLARRSHGGVHGLAFRAGPRDAAGRRPRRLHLAARDGARAARNVRAAQRPGRQGLRWPVWARADGRRPLSWPAARRHGRLRHGRRPHTAVRSGAPGRASPARLLGRASLGAWPAGSSGLRRLLPVGALLRRPRTRVRLPREHRHGPHLAVACEPRAAVRSGVRRVSAAPPGGRAAGESRIRRPAERRPYEAARRRGRGEAGADAAARARARGLRGRCGRGRRAGARQARGQPRRLRPRRARRHASRRGRSGCLPPPACRRGRPPDPPADGPRRDRRQGRGPRQRRRRLPGQAVRLRGAPGAHPYAAAAAAAGAAAAPRGGRSGPRAAHAPRDPRPPGDRADRQGVRPPRVLHAQRRRGAHPRADHQCMPGTSSSTASATSSTCTSRTCARRSTRRGARSSFTRCAG